MYLQAHRYVHHYYAIYGSRMATGSLWLSMFPAVTIHRNVPRAMHARMLPVECFIGYTVAFPRTVHVCPVERWGVPSGMLSCSQYVPAIPTFETCIHTCWVLWTISTYMDSKGDGIWLSSGCWFINVIGIVNVSRVLLGSICLLKGKLLEN